MNTKLTCIRLVAVSGVLLLVSAVTPLKTFANSEFASEASSEAASYAQSEASTESSSESGAGEIFAPGFGGGFYGGYGGPVGYGYGYPPPAVIPVSQPVAVPLPVPVPEQDTINVPLTPVSPPVYGVATVPMTNVGYARVFPRHHQYRRIYRQHVSPRVVLHHQFARRYRRRAGGG